MRLLSSLLSLVLLALAPAVPAAAQDANAGVKGLFLLTDYPGITVRPGTSNTINLRLRNYALDPDRYTLSVGGVPQGWTVTLLGGGQPVAAAMVATNDSTALQLRLDVPENAAMGSTANLTVVAKGTTLEKTLPIAVSLAKDLPAKLTIKPQLPSLRGTSKSSFEFQTEIKNDSGRNLVISLGAQAPRNFETSFTEQYGSQELSSIPIDAGQSKTVKLKVRPPSTSAANRYPVSVKASAEDASAETTVALEITGQPQLTISGRDGVLSGRAEAGKESAIPVIITNTGTAPADEITLTSSAPSGWKIEFDPKTLDAIAPGQNKEAQVRVTPPEKAIAGDYAPTFTATSRGETASTQFRVAVSTSTLWGIAGAGIIAIALLILVGAVARFGRR
ncbi:MAG: NEW3 domain-containing protein [Hyphomicrobiales bacterium]